MTKAKGKHRWLRFISQIKKAIAKCKREDPTSKMADDMHPLMEFHIFKQIARQVLNVGLTEHNKKTIENIDEEGTSWVNLDMVLHAA